MADRGKVPARLSMVMAAEAPVCVVFRRGPSKWVQMWRWDTETDEFTPGQWINSQVYAGESELHPSGEFLFASIRNERGSRKLGMGSYASISRPPYFSALAVFPDYGYGVALPDGIEGCPDGIFEWLHGIWCNSDLGRRGWQKGDGQDVFKEGVGFRLTCTLWRGMMFQKSLWAGDRRIPIADYGQVDIDQRGRPVVLHEGQVCLGEMVDGKFELRVLKDLNDYEFEAISPPDWALRWEGR